MQFIQYMNFFERCIGLRPKYCFSYNEAIVFVVQPKFVARVIGESGSNVRKLSERLRRRVKIVAGPSSIKDVEKFISSIVYPLKFKKLVVEGDEITIFAPPQSKALLIGRNKIKMNELEDILKGYFNIRKLKIV